MGMGRSSQGLAEFEKVELPVGSGLLGGEGRVSHLELTLILSHPVMIRAAQWQLANCDWDCPRPALALALAL